MPEASIREIISNALRYWESRRILYNLLLLGVVFYHLLPLGLEFGRSEQTPRVFIWFFLLAILANVLYCAAYLPDILVQLSDYRQRWLKYRWLLFGIGSLLAASLVNLFAAQAVVLLSFTF